MTGEPEPAPATDEALEERLSRPSAEVCATLARQPGDVLVLGAGGKMGPSLARMASRALDELGHFHRVIAVARFSDAAAAHALAADGIETIRCDLADRAAVAALPGAANIVFMAGQKFGTTAEPSATWAANVLVPAIVAERYAGSRIVAFSTGNVYPLVPRTGRGSREDDAPAPAGEYAISCLGRERMFEHVSRGRGTPVTIVRLNYAVDLRYGVLVDIARRIVRREPVDVTMGWFNVLWQGDANAQALRCLDHATSPPLVINLTGPETLSVRSVAERLGELLGQAPEITGREADDALLSDASRARGLFGAPSVPADRLIEWVATWVAGGGKALERPTKFEVRDGRF
ncbi:MAG TPA: NAD(P)-dependent oxidoreductase [Gemmatimonadaceae bacterium]|nr:NAD(P)-dependent oxidoreductase [Gemmatimonadaceae bacterium]